jgi:hypothetical protein
MNKYKIYVALHEEAKEGWVWLPFDSNLSADYASIRYPGTGWSVVCERRIIDKNYRNVYNSTGGTIHLAENGRFVVMSAWYRQKLGIFDTEPDVPLEIKDATGWPAMYRASRQHPSPAIRISISLALLSVFLGLAGLIEGAIALLK